MKSAIFLCALVVAVVEGGKRIPAVDELCDNSSTKDCLSKARMCIKVGASSEGLAKNKAIFRECLKENGVPAGTLGKILLGPSEKRGDRLESLDVSDEARLEIRNCLLEGLKLADDNGNLDLPALKERYTNGLKTALADRPALQEALTEALDNCGSKVSKRTDLKKFRRCMANTCIDNV